MDFVEQNQMGAEAALHHWYYRAKLGLLRNALRSSGIDLSKAGLVDVGCGIGVFLTLLEKSRLLRADQMVGVDPAAPDGAISIGGQVPILRSAPPDKRYDIALLMDVLEHVPNDREILEQAAGLVSAGGIIFITVPAFMWLWSSHDELLGHFRRYTIGSLRGVVNSVSLLELERLHYFYASILPPAALVRTLRRRSKATTTDMAPCHPVLNALLGSVLAVESRLAPANRLAGLTAVALCRKKG